MKMNLVRSCVLVALVAVVLPFSALAAPTPEAIDLVRKFVVEELHGNLDALADFDLATLEGHPLYGAPGRTFDTDDGNLVRALFDVLYADALPGLALPTLGTGRAYRGDTLNTFHTLFGRPIPDQPGRFAGLERHRPSDDLRARAAAIHRTNHTLGNLAPLPNRSLGRNTFNTYRGTHPAWRDAFPAFLENLRLALLADPGADPTLCQLVELNAEAFREFRAPDGLVRFAQRLDLDDYVDPATGLPIPHYASNAHFLAQSDADYAASADRYLAIAPILIQRRAVRMIARLRLLLPPGDK